MNVAAVSESFTYRQKTLALNDIPIAIEAMHEDGYVPIPNVLNAEEITAARAAIDRLWLSYLDRPGILDLAEARTTKRI